MGLVTLSLGIACALASAFTLIGADRRRDGHDAIVSLAMVWVWAIGASAIMVGKMLPPQTPPFFVYFGPPVDLALAAFVVLLHRRRPARWKAILILIAALQLTLHVAFGLGDKSAEASYLYKFALNVSFLAQLGCVIAPGGSYGVRRVLSGLSDWARGVRSRGHV